MRHSLAAAILVALCVVLLEGSEVKAVQGAAAQDQQTRAQLRQMLLAQFDSDGDGQLNPAEVAVIRQAMAELQQMAASGRLNPATQQRLAAGGACMQGQGDGLQQQGQPQAQGIRQMRGPGQAGPGAAAQEGMGPGGRRQAGRGPGGQRGPR